MTTCVCLIIDGACLFVDFLVFIGLVIAVISISFTLPTHIFDSLWVAKTGELITYLFRKFLICFYNYRYHLGSSLKFSILPVHFLTFQLVQCFLERLIHWFGLVLSFGKSSMFFFLYFFLESLFLAMLGILCTPLFLWFNQTALCIFSNV